MFNPLVEANFQEIDNVVDIDNVDVMLLHFCVLLVLSFDNFLFSSFQFPGQFADILRRSRCLLEEAQQQHSQKSWVCSWQSFIYFATIKLEQI